MQHQSPFLRLWELGKPEHRGRNRTTIPAAGSMEPENGDRLQKAIIVTAQKGIYADFVLGREESAGWTLNTQAEKPLSHRGGMDQPERTKETASATIQQRS